MFALGGFAALDQLAEGARMFSIEGLLERRAERVRLRVIDRHLDPSQRLEQKPLPSGGQHQKNDNGEFAPHEHGPHSTDRLPQRQGAGRHERALAAGPVTQEVLEERVELVV